MIIVHHLADSRSQRILWLLEELGLPYEVRRYERHPDTMLAPRSLREVDGLGKAPIVEEGPITISESGAIVDWLLERHGGGRLQPAPGTADWVLCRSFVHAAEGSFMPPLLLGLVFERTSGPDAPLLLRPVARAIARAVDQRFISPQLRLQLDRAEAALEDRPFLAGDALTVADIMMSFPLEAAAARGRLGAARTGIADWLERIHAREPCRRALERGGPYAFVPAPRG